MKILYLTTWDFANEPTDGVCKKIKSQIKVFKSYGYQVDVVFIRNSEIVFAENDKEQIWGKVGKIKKTPAYIKMYSPLKDKKYDWIYNRYGLMDPFYYRLLKKFYQNGAKILIEIPTYPYIGECKGGILYQLMFWWDGLYTPKLGKIIDRIVTYSEDEMIWNIPTIRIVNGIWAEDIKLPHKESCNNEIILLAVAVFQPSHGYERCIQGLADYYKNGGKRKIEIHMVGYGQELQVYESMVKMRHLENYVFFHGKKTGEELEDYYKFADIALGCFGLYKRNIYKISALKTAEYLMKGLPIISGCIENIFENSNEDFLYCFPNDSSPIDMEKVVQFYDRLYKNGEQRDAIEDRIRNFGEQTIDLKKTMWPIAKYLQNN